MTTITDERLAEMVGAGVPCAPPQPGEIAAVVQELRAIRAAASEPFAYTTQTSIDLLRERPGHMGSFALFLPFEGMDDIKGVEFVPLYASPQPDAVITEEMVQKGAEGLRKMYHGGEDEPFHLMAKAVLTAAMKEA